MHSRSRPDAEHQTTGRHLGRGRISRANDIDYTNSQIDAQSVHSMNMNQERQNKQHRQMVGPFAYHQPGPQLDF
jgi:hypothetical protein